MNVTAKSKKAVLRAAALAATALALPALSACGVNFSAQTDQSYTPSEGVSDRSGEVDVLNAMIVSGEDGTGRLIAGFANNDDTVADALVNARGADADAPVVISTLGGETAVPASGYLQLADEGAAVVVVTGETVVPGDFVRVTFSFTNAEPVTLNIPVVEQTGPYAGVTLPGESPSASPTESPTESPSASPEASASPSASATE